MTCSAGLAVVVVVVGLAVVTVGFGAAGRGAAGAAPVVGLTAAGAVVSTAAGAVVSGGTGVVLLTAPLLVAGFWASGVEPEPHAAPANVRASRPATTPVRNGRFMVPPPDRNL